jgi:hypothetical protein
MLYFIKLPYETDSKCSHAKLRFMRLNFLSGPKVQLLFGDGMIGYAKGAPLCSHHFSSRWREYSRHLD